MPHELRDRRRVWLEVVRNNDLPGYVDLVTEDVVWLPPAGGAIEGRPAFRQWLQPFFQRYHYDLSLDARLRVVDERAVEVGEFVSRLTQGPDGETTEHSGRYVALWRRDPDGEWRIERYADVSV